MHCNPLLAHYWQIAMTTNSQAALSMAGSLTGDGLQSLLLAAAARRMYASILIDGPTSGTIHIVDGSIALVGSEDMRTMRVAQHQLTNLLRDSIGARTGTYRCAPLTDVPEAHESRSVGIQQVLNAVGAISSVDSIDTAAAPIPSTPVNGVAPEASLAPTTPLATAPTPADSNGAQGAGLATVTPIPTRSAADIERPVRASQLRKMLRVKRKAAAAPTTENTSVARILEEPENAVDRQAALRTIIRDLAVS